MDVRSAGTSSSAKRRLNENDILWADRIVVMESHHAKQVRNMTRPLGVAPSIDVLGIPDDYRYMDAELVDWLRDAVEPLIAR